jgi:hypothetical protein
VVLLTRKGSQVQTLWRPPDRSDQRKRYAPLVSEAPGRGREHLTDREVVSGVGIAVTVIDPLASTFFGWLHSSGGLLRGGQRPASASLHSVTDWRTRVRDVPDHHQPCSLPLRHGPVEPGPAPPGVPQRAAGQAEALVLAHRR